MQILKKNIRTSIARAALGLFARHGFAVVSVAQIASEAGVSTGNIYHYYSGKKDLLYSVVRPQFLQKCFGLLRNKLEISCGKQSDDLKKMPQFFQANTELLEFLCKNRQPLLILLQGCEGTNYASFNSEILSLIVNAVSRHWEMVNNGKNLEAGEQRVLLGIIYENLLKATVVILQSGVSEKRRKVLLSYMLEYHLGGLSAVL